MNEQPAEQPVAAQVQPEETGTPKNKKMMMFAGLGILLVLLIGAAIFLWPKGYTKETAFDKMLEELTSTSYVETTQEFDSSFLNGSFTFESDFSDVSNPSSQGSINYEVNFFTTASAGEEFVAIGGDVYGRLTKFEADGVTEADAPLPLNEWFKVGKDGKALTGDLLIAEGAYSLNTALGNIYIGNFEDDARTTIVDRMKEAATFNLDDVKEEELDGEAVFVYEVEFDTAKLVELNKSLSSDYNVYAGDDAGVEDASSYTEKATMYVSKKTGRLLKVEAKEEGTELVITYKYLDAAPSIVAPEAADLPN